MANQDLYRQTLQEMVDPRHPLVVPAGRIPWDELDARVSFWRSSVLSGNQHNLMDLLSQH